MNMKLSNEQELLRSAQAFDLDSLAAIYDLYSPGIYRYTLRLLGDDCLAEDCVAETFLRYLNALRAGQGPRDHLQAYLYRIAHNWITDFYRRQPPPPLMLDESVPDGEYTNPTQQVDLRSEQAHLRLALRTLTADQRQVLMLRFVEDWGLGEVAEVLQKPVGAIKALQHRALAALRNKLKN
jgi:RNA polymerase sigma-70 factor, ECF subfamily